MRDLLVSVIIPAYGQGQFLADAIQSVLNQTYPNFEVIVVNDASPDDSAAITRSFEDPRVILLEHDINKGLSAARNTALRVAKGELIAFLDADDMFLPQKLASHVDYYAMHPRVEATYNARYELHYSSTKIRTLYRPPATVGLRDFVLGFPFAPSDLVLRRDCLERVGYFDERLVFFGEDQDYYCRIALEGCIFGYANRALNLRRHHSGRYDRRFSERMAHDREILDAVFRDPRCPSDIKTLRDQALANHLIVRVFHAFAQNQTKQGQAFLREAVERDPVLLEGKPNRLESWFADNTANDFNLDHACLLNSIRHQMPEELVWDENRQSLLVARGFLRRATIALLWDQSDEAAGWFKEAAAHNAATDKAWIEWVVHLLMDIDFELGPEVADNKLNLLDPYLSQLGARSTERKLKALLSLNRALNAYQENNPNAPRFAIGAIRNNPKYLQNRGLLAILRNLSLSAIRSSSYQKSQK